MRVKNFWLGIFLTVMGISSCSKDEASYETGAIGIADEEAQSNPSEELRISVFLTSRHSLKKVQTIKYCV